MATARFAWGIDVGNRALKAVKLVPDGAGYRIDDFEVIEHENVLANAGDNREALVQTALANFVQRHPQKGGIAAIGVSGQQSFARFIKLPPVEEKKIPEIVRFEAIQQIPFPLDDVEWSYQLFREADSPDVEVGIFAMRKELIARHIAYFTDVDLNVQVVQMNPLAVYNAMYHDGQIDGTTMIVDLGAENADLIIADGETVWLRSIPIGGNNFTEALVKAFKLNFQKAEDLKRNAATSKYARQIMQAMKPVFADLVGEIQRSIGFYASVHRDSRIGKVIALGGTFRLPSLQKYLSQNLQLEVVKIDRLGAGAPADAKMAAAYNENLLSSAGAYGLALQAMGEGKITSSLLPAAIQREKRWRDKTKWFGAAAALFVLGTGVKMGAAQLEQFKLDQAKPLQDRIAGVQRTAQANDTKWAAIEQEGGPDRTLILNVKSLEQHRDTWQDLLADVHAAVMSANPQPALLGTDVAAIKAIPRNQRSQIFVEELTSEYRPDLTDLLAANDSEFKTMVGVGGAGVARFNPGAMGARGGMPGYGGGYDDRGGAGPAAAPVAGAAAATRGYVVTLRLRTPNRGQFAFVNDTLIKSLRAIDLPAAFPDRGYYVAKATIISTTPVAQRAGANAGPGAAGPRGFRPGAGPGAGFEGGMPLQPGRAFRPPAGGGFPRPGFDPNAPAGPADIPRPSLPAPAVATAEQADPFVDPLTGEDIRADTDVTVVFVVVLDPPKPVPAGEATASAAQQ